jgi:hypothetical protein
MGVHGTPVQMEELYDRAPVQGFPAQLREEIHQNEHRRMENVVELVRDLVKKLPDYQAVTDSSEELTEALMWAGYIELCVTALLLTSQPAASALHR